MVPMRRALRLVIDGKAEIVEADHDRVVRSERLTMPRPAVIRLTKFIHVPRRFRRQVTNTFLFARDRYRCQYCGRTPGGAPPARVADARPPDSAVARRNERLEQRRDGVQPVQHAQGEPSAERDRDAPDDAPGRAALRAPELGGSPPDARPRLAISDSSTVPRCCTRSRSWRESTRSGIGNGTGTRELIEPSGMTSRVETTSRGLSQSAAAPAPATSSSSSRPSLSLFPHSECFGPLLIPPLLAAEQPSRELSRYRGLTRSPDSACRVPRAASSPRSQPLELVEVRHRQHFDLERHDVVLPVARRVAPEAAADTARATTACASS